MQKSLNVHYKSLWLNAGWFRGDGVVIACIGWHKCARGLRFSGFGMISSGDGRPYFEFHFFTFCFMVSRAINSRGLVCTITLARWAFSAFRRFPVIALTFSF